MGEDAKLVFVDAGRRAAETIRTARATGAYASCDGPALCAQVTADLQSSTHDAHLGLRWSSQRPTARPNTSRHARRTAHRTDEHGARTGRLTTRICVDPRRATCLRSDLDLHAITDGPHVVRQLWRGGRPARHTSVLQPELAPVPRTDQALPFDTALIQRGAVVAARRAHRMQTSRCVDQDHVLATDLDAQQAVGGYVGNGCCVGPVSRLLLLVSVAVDPDSLAVREVSAEVSANTETRGS